MIFNLHLLHWTRRAWRGGCGWSLRVGCGLALLVATAGVQGQNLTREVAADTVRFPVPDIDADWNLVWMPHNCSDANV